MKIEWSGHHPSLTSQLKRQNILCNDLTVRKIERNREAVNTLFAGGFIDGDEMESIRMRMSDEAIEYAYLNMDEAKFYESQLALVESMGKRGTLWSVMRRPQILIAGGKKPFTEGDAVRLCQRLTGVIKEKGK